MVFWVVMLGGGILFLRGTPPDFCSLISPVWLMVVCLLVGLVTYFLFCLVGVGESVLFHELGLQGSSQ